MTLPKPKSARPKLAPAKPMSPTAKTVAWVLLALSALAIWTVMYGLVFSAFQQHRANALNYAELRKNLSAATTPIGGVIDPGTPIALLNVPAAGITDSVIVEGTSSAQLRSGPGHRRDTPLPGQPGVSVIFARSATFGAPFAKITDLKVGQTLNVTTGQGKFDYVVNDVRRGGDPLPVPLVQGGSRLILETAVTPGWQSGFAPARTVYVDASLLGKTQPAPSGRLRSIPAADKELHGDTSVLIPLIFWLQALVLVTMALVWGRARWGHWQTWIVGVPVLLAVLWGASNDVLMLLPNLV